jgi:hypothetical protein
LTVLFKFGLSSSFFIFSLSFYYLLNYANIKKWEYGIIKYLNVFLKFNII